VRHADAALQRCRRRDVRRFVETTTFDALDGKTYGDGDSGVGATCVVRARRRLLVVMSVDELVGRHCPWERR
jgi:hypothetical protein